MSAKDVHEEHSRQSDFSKDKVIRHMSSRDHTIDLLRGLAICLMVPANLAPQLDFMPPEALRWCYSMAAPIFLFVCGLTIGMRHYGSPSQATIIAKRTLMLLALAAMNDIAAYQLVPLVSVDVLYLIALGVPVCWLASRASLGFVLLTILLIVILSVTVRHLFGYADYPAEWQLGDMPALSLDVFQSVAANWLWQGWFPLFPWLAIMLAGVAVAHIRYGKKAPGRWLNLAILTLPLGGVGWQFWPGEAYIREGYAEMFYPPNPSFLLIALGVCLLLLQALSAMQLQGPRLVACLGRHSLLVYLCHTLLINYVVANLLAPLSPVSYIATALGLLLALWLIATLRETRFTR